MPVESGLPILPGPFSFLASAGAAAGRIGQEKERLRDKNRAEAQQKANNFLALRAAGLMSPEEFAKPEVQQVFNDAGFGIPSSAPTSGERIEGIRRRATAPDQPGMTIPLGQLIPSLTDGMGTGADVRVKPSGMSSLTDEERMLAGVPLRSQVGGERVAAARTGAQEDIIRSGTPAQRRAVLGTPSATTAQAAEDQATDTQFNSLALRAVDAAITQSGGRIDVQKLMNLAENAWSLAQEDAKMRGYVADEQFTKPYIMAVITSRLREQRAQDISAQGASNRSAATYQDYISILRDQQRLAQQQLVGLVKPSNTEFQQAAIYERKRRLASTPAERQAVENNTLLKQAYDKVQMYTQASARLNAEIAGYSAQLQGALSHVIPGVSGTRPSSEAGTMTEAMLNTMVQRLDADPKYADANTLQTDLQATVQSGELSQADYDAIVSRINQRRQTRGLPLIPTTAPGGAPAAAPAPRRYSSGASAATRVGNTLGALTSRGPRMTAAQRETASTQIATSVDPEKAIRHVAATQDLSEDEFNALLASVNRKLQGAGKPRINPDMGGTP